MNLLAVETASSVCGIALFLEGKLAGIVEEEVGRQHSEKLPLYFERLLGTRRVSLMDLDGIAVSIGPGSFTGLRIGLSFAKGLAFSRQLPIAPVPTLEAMVRHAAPSRRRVRCVLHSHRDFVYVQDFSGTGAEPTGPPLSARWEEAVGSLPDGSVICQYGCDELLKRTQSNFPAVPVRPSARGVGEVALTRFDRIKKIDFHDLEPEYVSHFPPSMPEK